MRLNFSVSKKSGFTLIELVMVIVILGVLAAVALPKFVDLSEQAQAAKLAAVGGAITSATQINRAASIAGSPKAVAFATGVAGTTCNKEALSLVADVDWDKIQVSEKSGGTIGCRAAGGRSPSVTRSGICSLNMVGADASKAIDVPIECEFPAALTTPSGR